MLMSAVESYSDFDSETRDLNYVDIIETVISGLNQSGHPMVSHGEAGEIWKFCYGSVDVFVQLNGKTDDDFLTIWSPVLPLPLPVAKAAELFRKLLELNWLTTLEAHFAIAEDHVNVVATRTLAGITAGEIARSITIVATLADDYDDTLKAEFSEN